jgi:hypothetical protein
MYIYIHTTQMANGHGIPILALEILRSTLKEGLPVDPTLPRSQAYAKICSSGNSESWEEVDQQERTSPTQNLSEGAEVFRL